MASLNTMVKRCAGLIGTNDVSAWENQFLTDIYRKTAQGDNTTSLTEKQIDALERIFEKSFSG